MKNDMPPKDWTPSEPKWMRTERKMMSVFAVILAVLTTAIVVLMSYKDIDELIIMGFLLFTLIASAGQSLYKNYLPFIFVSVPGTVAFFALSYIHVPVQ